MSSYMEEPTRNTKRKSEINYGMDFGSYRSLISYKRELSDPDTPRYAGECEGGVPAEFWCTKSGEEFVGDEVIDNGGKYLDHGGQCPSIKLKLDKEEILLNGKPYNPKEIAVKYIKRVKDVTAELMTDNGIVFKPVSIVSGVPVRYNREKRKIIQEAIAEALGIDMPRVRVVSEPILAAIAYNYFFGEANRPVLAFDVGHGTFDTAVLIPNPKAHIDGEEKYIAKSSDGNFNAGLKIEERLISEMVKRMKANPGTLNISLLDDENHGLWGEIFKEARRIKEVLSRKEKVTAFISFENSGRAHFSVTKQEFESLIFDIVEENVELAYNVFLNSGIGKNPDMDIILVGGSTYIPLFSKLLKKKFDWLPEDRFKQRFPERAISLGAAIYSESVEEAPAPISTVEIPFAYAIQTFSNYYGKHMLDVQISSHSKLPCTAKTSFYTRFSNQEFVSFDIYELNSGTKGQLVECDSKGHSIYSCTHRFDAPVDKGTRVDFEMTLDRNGIAHIEIIDEYGKKSEAKPKIPNIST